MPSGVVPLRGGYLTRKSQPLGWRFRSLGASEIRENNKSRLMMWQQCCRFTLMAYEWFQDSACAFFTPRTSGGYVWNGEEAEVASHARWISEARGWTMARYCCSKPIMRMRCLPVEFLKAPTGISRVERVHVVSEVSLPQCCCGISVTCASWRKLRSCRFSK